ncbi:hypothetical protein Celaphus_00018709 [Cervus elaphus hippelaphus]|uniref:Uncharacterized protein n=1 Tax=Cervus elaphus hippelaphus TaxID=46360 RepID=A0A212CM00_CEREH|nr:hypothetical protein Celaphus_00018709 [Cervus elaphus hippelaphus]
MLPGLANAAAAHRCSWSSLCRLRLRCRAAARGSSDRQGECPAPTTDSAEAALEDKAGLGAGCLASGSTPPCPSPTKEPSFRASDFAVQATHPAGAPTGLLDLVSRTVLARPPRELGAISRSRWHP